MADQSAGRVSLHPCFPLRLSTASLENAGDGGTPTLLMPYVLMLGYVMDLKCELCGKTIVVADDIGSGQHVRCPFCDGKFTYAGKREITEDDLRKALAECRKNPEQDRYYKNAPAGARLYIGLVFYGFVFKDVLNKEQFVSAFMEIGKELKERDLRYLLQYEDDSEMREYLSDRLAAICGRTEDVVVPPAAKTRKIPKLGIIREKTPEPLLQPVVVEPVIPDPVPPRATTKGFDFKVICGVIALIAAVAVVAWLVIGVWKEHERIAAKERYERWKLSEQSKRTDEGRSQRSEKSTTSEAVRLVASEMPSKKPPERQKLIDAFLMYLEREKVSLTNIVIRSTVAYDEIVADQKRLSDALAEIDKENAVRANRAMTNGWIRYEKPEVVMMVLKHKVINDLAAKYIGEDFSALCNSCRAKIKSVMQLHREEEQLLAENRKKYQQAVQGDDERVRKKLEKAESMRVEFNKDIDRCVSERKAQLASKREVLLQLRSSPSQTSSVMNERVVVEAEILRLEKEIANLERFAESGKASAAHVAATYAESATRQRADHALNERQDNDNAVRMRLEHERDLFAIAMEYEGRSLDRIGSAMQSRREILSVRMSDAKAKLDDINRTSLNADFLTDSQLKSIREKVGMKIENRILNHVQ